MQFGGGSQAVHFVVIDAATPCRRCGEIGVTDQGPQRAAVPRLTDDEEVGEVVDGLHQWDEVAPLGHRDQTVSPMLGLRHQPEAHLGDDAEVSLGEQAGRIGAEAVFVFVPALGVGQRAHAGTHHFAVGKHDLHAAACAEVVAVRAHGVADPVIQGISDRAAPPRIGCVDPHLEVAILDMAI